MSNLRSLAGLTATVAIALVAWSCETRPNALAPETGGPLFHFHEFECTPFKMTGGGRIDYPPGTAEKNPPSTHQYQTFGAHVISSGQLAEDGMTCLADKGSLEWIDHSIMVNGHPLNFHSVAITFAELATDAFHCSDGAAHWGGRVRLQNTGEEYDFEVWDCDNGEPGVGNDGFAISVPGVGYEVVCPESENPPAEPTCTLTGGNRQFHPTH